MGILDSLKSAGKSLFNDLDKTLSRITSQSTFTRVVYAAYLIAAADGKVDDSEKVMLQKVIARKLPHFKAGDIVKALQGATDEMELSDVTGRLTLIREIAKSAGNDDAEIIMVAVLAVANADGEFSPSEQKVALDILNSLGLRRADYGL